MAITKVTRTLLSTGIDDQSNATAITIDSSEQVGIGLANQANKLQVDGDICIGKATTSADLKSTLKMRGANGSNQLQVFDLINDGENGRVDFKYNRAGNAAQTIMSFGATVGNVGIGTTSPARILSAKSSSVTIANFESTSSTAGLISFSDSNTTNDVTVRAGAIGDNLVLQAGGSEKMRIISTGEVGIGTTPATHYTGYEALDIGDTLSLFSNNTSTNVSTLTNNGYLNSNASAWVRKVTDEATMYSQVNGDHRFSTAASGSAGAAITWSEKVRIQAAGGISFNGDTAAANALDDYEEGTWTPAYNNGGSIAYTTQYGSYVKIGRLVHLACNIDVDTVSGTNSGAMQISGAPFTNDGVDETGGSVGINLSGWLNGSGSDTIQINATNASILPAKDTINDIYRGTDIGTGFVRWSIVYMTDQ